MGARDYTRTTYEDLASEEKAGAFLQSSLYGLAGAGLASLPVIGGLDANVLAALSALPAFAFFNYGKTLARQMWLEKERNDEVMKRGGNGQVLGAPPQRDAFAVALEECRSRGVPIIDKYLVGYELASGAPLWLKDDAICSHGCVFAKTGVGKTLWMESLIFQQMARGRASGCTFIDAKRDSGTLAHIILMALLTGRIEDLVVIDPFDAVHSYNFVMTNQRADVKARKVLRAGLPPTSDQSTTKHYDRLAADSIYRMVRALESFGLNWSIQDMAVALSAFNLAYPQLRNMLNKIGARKAMVELGHLASSYRTGSGKLDTTRITDNLRGISSELHAISGSEMGEIFCTEYTDLVLTDAILRGKIVYFMLPRLEEAESAARMVKLFREDLEVSIGEITSSRHMNLEDPHLVIIDEGASTFGPTWANLFELARKGRFSLIFGAQSTGGLTDSQMGLSEAFYERVMANVNLKVMMRIGDNRTAEDMAKWFGKIATTKRSVGAGVMSNAAAAMPVGGLLGRESQSINISEDEEDLVSAEELKHEMSAEKGLAWFDMGDGRVVKGRSFWVDSDVPETWEGREFIPTFEKFEKDGLGLSRWVDEQILSQEEQETSPQFATDKAEGKIPGAPTAPRPVSQNTSPMSATPPQGVNGAGLPGAMNGGAPQQEEKAGPLKFGDVGALSRFRRGVVNAFSAPKVEEKEKPKGPPRPKLRLKG
ncbi:MAG: TraM recognition domain-containing protein [Bdellovibrionales bacterium]|nr:TraM recognition domain-containing protein [Bdellovibrionales bacterium]